MNQNEIVKTLVVKYGALDAGRHYLREARRSMSAIKVGLAENNPMLMAKDIELLATHLDALSFMFGDKETKEQLQNLEKNI